ncbi:hypothetical protein jhhlp_004931 [Lomentospora prolificans]|uniref:6-phosphogluconate dehydrogenase, decarboxylating n=1 Tax=Lomentospora prolificans TaxID=41688 RepID=A0A2N3N7Y5_9PEZI|nr:hypothetical protein jhhlp_004931 [Lomentospora prolificans]
MDIKQIGMIGAGSMGSMMSLMFAEYDIDVHFFEPSDDTADRLLKYAKDNKLDGKITRHKTHKDLCGALSAPKVFIFSIPHGAPADKSIEDLRPFLEKGDLIMDGSNEKWTETERRQKELEPHGIHYIGMGVSGGYQSARKAPSLSPGGSKEALDLVFPFLQKIAAKDKDGNPCVAKLGPGGSGHYVKMIHNGIEQGMMTPLCEAWAIMNHGLSMNYEEIADVFDSWNTEGPLRDTFLVEIGRDVCRATDPKTGSHVLSNVRDKVVQDADDSEGTGIWACEEIVRLHVPGPTILTSHLLRLASADAAKREVVRRAFASKIGSPSKLDVDKGQFLEKLRDAVYASFLESFIQGLHTLAKADEETGWNLNFRDILQVWRAGCIIRSNALVDVLDEVYASRDCDKKNLLGHPKIGAEFQRTYPGFKQVVAKSIEADLYVPSLSASLEYLKYSSGTDLPPSFEEAELDYFGQHMFDLKTEDAGKPVTGSHHFEWHPALGVKQHG